MKWLLTVALSPFVIQAVWAQRSTSTRSRVVQETQSSIPTGIGPIETPSGTGTPCAQVSALQYSFFASNPSATLGPFIPASLANACADSAPIVAQDATDLIDGLLAMIQFQSTLDFLDNPPAGYPIKGVNLVDGMNSIRSKVTSGQYTSEVAFQYELATLLASAHDGHLAYLSDALTVFQFGQQFGPLVSVSTDGKAVPELFLFYEMRAYVNRARGERPSAIEQINGVDAIQYINQQVLNSTFQGYQDADAAYNSFLWSPNLGEGVQQNPGIFSGSTLERMGDTTSIKFTNGTTIERENFAVATLAFTGVDDGASFYDAFCNAAKKPGLLSRRDEPTLDELYEKYKQGNYWKPNQSRKLTRRQSTSGSLVGYPQPEVIASDASIAGFFLSDAGFEDVAVLLVRSFSTESQTSFQNTLTTFLNSCRSNNKQQLIIDMTGNPGGVVGLGFELFKQLFPTLDPWASGNFRAHDGYRLLGEVITEYSSAVLKQYPNNYDRFERAYGVTPYASESKLTTNGTRFASFAQFYGPVKASNNQGSYTNQFRQDISNPDYSQSFSGITISGYDSENPLGPQPFDPKNMIIFTDGQCSSTCASVSHLLKWQGKVKSVAIGGRPRTGPMQSVGGVKGSQVQTFLELFAIAYAGYTVADSSTRRSWSGTVLDTIIRTGEYVLQRTRSGGQSASELSFNVQNNIAEGDRSLTPLQFAYEAADCRLFYQEQHIRTISTSWNTVASQAFGLNNTSVFSACVDGSTNQPSSLSGNSALYNNGQITNVTGSTQDYGIANPGGGDSAASRILGSAWLLVLTTMLGTFMIM